MVERSHEISADTASAKRFRGDMEKDRTDGGFLPVDRGSYSVSTQPTKTDSGEDFARDRADEETGKARWPDENAGPHTGRTSRVAERHGGAIDDMESPTSVRGPGNDTLR